MHGPVFTFLLILFQYPLISRFTAAEYFHQVITILITESDDVNQNGLLRVCGTHLRWG
jgi:hypothetical protein